LFSDVATLPGWYALTKSEKNGGEPDWIDRYKQRDERFKEEFENRRHSFIIPRLAGARKPSEPFVELVRFRAQAVKNIRAVR
jgi:hypothetical protein